MRAMKDMAAEVLQNDCGEVSLTIRRRRQPLRYAAKIKATAHHPSASVVLDHWKLHWGHFTRDDSPFANKVNSIFETEGWTYS